MQYQHPQLDESVNVTRTNPLKEFATYLAAIVFLITSVYYLSIYAVDIAVDYVDPDKEKWIWNSMFKDEFLTKDKNRNNKTINQEKYLQELLDKIPKTNLPRNDYKVIVVNSSEINALALPSGRIVVFTGLLEKIKSENALVFILGHELGHFANRDHLRGMGRNLLASIFLAPLISSESSTFFSDFSSTIDMHFSREQETAADEFGIKTLQNFYSHVGGSTEFFEYLEKNEHEPIMLKYLSTHPISSERIQHIRQIIKNNSLRTLATKAKRI